MFLTPGAKLAQKVDVKNALYEAIASTRGEQAAATTVTACRAFQELRAALHEPPTTVATRRAIKLYLAALRYAVHDNGLPTELSVGLLWVNAFDGNDHCVVNDLALDHVAALFNLGVCEASLATVAYRNRRTDPGAMKVAAQHFQVAAGYFAAASDLPSPGGIRAITSDLYPSSLRALKMVMLGNAQQILYEIALESGIGKAAYLAKFAVGARDYYLIAEESCSDADVVNTCINAYVGRPAGALAAYFDVVAQAAQANASRDDHDMPQQLTRLRKAQESVNTGLNTVKSLDTSSLATVTNLRHSLITELENLKVSLHRRREEAEAENRQVYYCSPADDVPDIVGRKSAKPADVSNVMSEEAVDERLRPFASLPEALSPELSGVAAKYTDMVAATVADAVSSINTTAAHLQELVLQADASITTAQSTAANDAARPQTRPASSPEEEQKAIDALRFAQERGGLETLRELQGQVIRLANETKIQVQSIDTLLQGEDAEDRQLRGTYHVTRPTSAEIGRPYFTNLAAIRSKLDQAANADKLVASQIDDHAAAISLATAFDIMGFVPPSSKVPGDPTQGRSSRIDALLAEMRPQVSKGREKLAEKSRLVQEFERKKHLENAYTATAAVTAGGAEVEQCRAKIEEEYGELKKQAGALCDEMGNVSEYLADANARLKTPAGPAKESDEGSKRMSEVYKHQAASMKFKELMGHLEQGSDFYSRERDVISLLKKDIEGFVLARRTEASDISRNQGSHGNVHYGPQGGLYPSGPQYPPNPRYAANDHNYPPGTYGERPPYQGPPSAWRRQ